jgi:hypothetical protein
MFYLQDNNTTMSLNTVSKRKFQNRMFVYLPTCAIKFILGQGLLLVFLQPRNIPKRCSLLIPIEANPIVETDDGYCQ